MVRRVERQLHFVARSMAEPRVREVHFLPNVPEDADLRHASRGREEEDVVESRPGEKGVAATHAIVGEAVLHEPAESGVHAGPRLDLTADQLPARIILLLGTEDRPLPRQESFRPHGPAGEADELAVAHLRNEPGVGAEIIAELS